ncbi:MAG: EamA family transporter [Victivallaceae bacterium]|nr:DMT family transporter [Victivallaceae bacterium]
MFSLSGWFVPILISAVALGLYDLCKKHAVDRNSVMPVLFFATLSGTVFFVAVTALTGGLFAAAECSWRAWLLIGAKSVLVSGGWICVYYAMRELPISIASPIRATAPFWTFIGGMLLLGEVPSLLQGAGMLVIFGGYYCFSVLGRLEGISFSRHRGIHLIVAGTLLGSASALYDKFLLGSLGLPRMTVQFWFSVDLVFVLGLAYFIRKTRFRSGVPFVWRWSIPMTGVLLIAADYLYFYAISMPDTQIAILSLLRRCSCVVTFAAGCACFRDANVKRKAAALALILLGVILLALAG